MFLRNYDNANILRHFTGDNSMYGNYSTVVSINSSTVFGDGNINVRSSNGTVQGYVRCYAANFMKFITPMTKGTLCLGTGNTAVTYDDYKLSGDIVDESKLTYVSLSVGYDADKRTFSKTVIYTYTNETEDNITISEWGIYENMTYGGGTIAYFQSSNRHILLFREVLETPIVIEPGTSATLKFKVEIPTNHP